MASRMNSVFFILCSPCHILLIYHPESHLGYFKIAGFNSSKNQEMFINTSFRFKHMETCKSAMWSVNSKHILAIIIWFHFLKFCQRCQVIQQSYFPTCPPPPSPPHPWKRPPLPPPSSAPLAWRRARRRPRRRTSQQRRPSTRPCAAPSPLSPTQACSGCSTRTFIATTWVSTTPTFPTDTITQSEMGQCC